MDRFIYTNKSGHRSAQVGLSKIDEVAKANILSNDDPFTINHSGHKITHLAASDARSRVHDILHRASVGGKVDVFKSNGNKVFHAERVAVALSICVDPYRKANVSAERIDAGVDNWIIGPVTPMAPAIIIAVGVPSHSSTFGNTLSILKYTDGPMKGLESFFAEHYNIKRNFKEGQHVGTNDVIYVANGSIEAGWSDGYGSYAWNKLGYGEGQYSRIGKNYSDLLKATGSVGGLVLSRSLSGVLPPQFNKDWKSLV